jgi:glycosyltransferase involved in cell wall biosynthesis
METEQQIDAGGDEKLTFLYFGNHWLAENRTSSHQIARELAKRHKVLYFECPGLRAPGGSGRDLKKVFSKLWGFLRGARRVPEGLTVRTLLQLPFHRFRAVRWLNRLLVKAAVRWAMWREGVKDPITWFHLPHLPYLVGALKERAAVYYCIDDYSAFPGVNPEVVRAMDDETTRRADTVFIASDTLLEGKKALNPNTHVSPHGVEVEHFARAQDPLLPVPEGVAHLPGPVVGFFGLIERFIDLDLLDYLAEQRPHWTFLMIGRVAVPEEQVPRRPNVHLIGKRPYEQLPAYGKRFDAAIIPYRPGAWSFHANPIKLREYLAMGKPVVSVETPQVNKFADVVEVARSREEFLAALDKVLLHPPSADKTRARMDRVASSGWDRRVAEVVHTIRDTPRSR